MSWVNSALSMDAELIGCRGSVQAGAYTEAGRHPRGEHPYQAMDGNLGTKFLDFEYGDLIVNFGAPVAVASYDWATANDAPARDPTKWTLEGSNDGATWTTVDDTYSSNPFSPTDDRQAYQGESVDGGAFSTCGGGAVILDPNGGGGRGGGGRGGGGRGGGGRGMNLVETLVSMPDTFSPLVAAVTAAGLAPTLSGAGPFTVFAPTNDAFAALGQSTINSLLADPTGQLASILTYHVAAGHVLSSQLHDGMQIPTVEGESITVTIDSRGVMLNGAARVTQADVECSNGVAHVIDTVLMPPSTKGGGH